MVTRTSAILGPDGQPLEIKLLSQEIATTESFGPRALQLGGEASGLTPERLGDIMRQAAMGHSRAYLTLAIEMEERYLHYASQLQTRRLALDAVPISITTPKGVPAAIVDAVETLINGARFSNAIQDLNDALSKGYSVVEPMWEYQEKYLQPVEYKHRDARLFRYDEKSLTALHLVDEMGRPGQLVKRPYFLTHHPRIRAGLPIRAGLARPAAWAFLIQSFTLQDWAAFTEIYGIPFRVGKYHDTATVDDKKTLLRAVRSISNDAAAIIPSRMEIEFHAVTGTQGEKVFGSLLDYIDRQISKLIVGQTMTAEDGASLGQAKIHNEVRLDILRADARQMAATLNQDLIEPFVAMNFGPQAAYPHVEYEIRKPEDIKALADALGKVVPLGLRVSARQVRDKLGLSDPGKDDEVLMPPAASAQSPGATDPASLSMRHVSGCQCGGCLMAVRLAADSPTGADDTDQLAADALSDWEAIADPLLEQIFAIAAESGSYDEVLRKLDGLRINSEPLRQRLAMAMTIARGVGDVRG